MMTMSVRLIWLALYHFYTTISAAAEEECRVLLYFKPMKDRTLLNHVMIRIDIPREDVCSIRCFLEPNCLSYNVGPLEHSNRYLCEISDSTDVRHPGDLVQRLGFTYQGIKSPCNTDVCGKNMTCQAGYTSKGYRCMKNITSTPLNFSNLVAKEHFHNCSDAPTITGVYNTSHHDWGLFPVYCDQTYDGGGWTMVLKVVSGLSPLDVGGIWSSPSLYHENLNETFDLTSVYPTHYKNRIVLNWKNFNPKEVRVVIYKDSQQVTSLKFNATGTDNLNWFSHENLIYSPWSDLKMFPSVNFGLLGPIVSDRFFEITGPYTGCETDIGWLVVTSHPVCPWDRRSPQPSIQYSKQRVASRMENYGNVGIADVLAVFVR
nr:uncharacterized protein LOC131775392 [Pocillopora verrucosa]